MADSSKPEDVTIGGDQADKLIGASIPYKLEPGGVYLIEVKQWAYKREEASHVTEYYQRRYKIDVQFIFTRGEDFALKALPGLKTDDTALRQVRIEEHRLVMGMATITDKNLELWSDKRLMELETDNKEEDTK